MTERRSARRLALAAELEARNAAHEAEYWLPQYQALTELECRAMAAGVVPEWLRDVCRGMVELTLETGAVDYVGLARRRRRAAAAPAGQ